MNTNPAAVNSIGSPDWTPFDMSAYGELLRTGFSSIPGNVKFTSQAQGLSAEFAWLPGLDSNQ